MCDLHTYSVRDTYIEVVILVAVHRVSLVRSTKIHFATTAVTVRYRPTRTYSREAGRREAARQHPNSTEKVYPGTAVQHTGTPSGVREFVTRPAAVLSYLPGTSYQVVFCARG